MRSSWDVIQSGSRCPAQPCCEHINISDKPHFISSKAVTRITKLRQRSKRCQAPAWRAFQATCQQKALTNSSSYLPKDIAITLMTVQLPLQYNRNENGIWWLNVLHRGQCQSCWKSARVRLVYLVFYGLRNHRPQHQEDAKRSNYYLATMSVDEGLFLRCMFVGKFL